MAFLIAANFSAIAQGTTYYQLEAGSTFTPFGGNPLALSGSFEISSTKVTVPVPDGDQEIDVIIEKVENLRWSADSWLFESGKPSDSFSVTRVLAPAGGLTGGANEFVLDSTIQITLPEYQLARIRLDSPNGGDPVRVSPFELVWPGRLHRVELFDNASLLIGVMSISTVVVPEPSAIALIAIALVPSAFFLRRANRVSRHTPFPKSER